MRTAYGASPAGRSKAQQSWANSQQNMASKYGIKPSSAMIYSFGRASPRSSDQQQGQLAEPPKQSGQASSSQPGGTASSGDYSAYSSGGGYSPRAGRYTDPNGVVRRRQAPPANGYGSRIGMEGQIGTADFIDGDRDGVDDRHQVGPGVAPSQGPSRNQYYQQLQQQNDARAAQGGDVPVYAAQSPPLVQSPQFQQQYFMPPQYVNGMPDFRQRDAFIASINNALGNQMSFGTPTPQPPQLNFPALWQQAGDMVSNGWTNPLAGLFA